MTAVVAIRTIANFVAQHGVTMTARQVRTNPLWTGPKRPTAKHYRCVPTHKGLMLVMHYTAHDGHEPLAHDVLEAMAIEASMLDNPGTVAKLSPDLASALEQQKKKLYTLLGDEATQQLISTL